METTNKRQQRRPFPGKVSGATDGVSGRSTGQGEPAKRTTSTLIVKRTTRLVNTLFLLADDMSELAHQEDSGKYASAATDAMLAFGYLYRAYGKLTKPDDGKAAPE